ncbi:hypothetical protein Celaphus_00012130, partial [Cervus elaphus hippelaphus]
SIKEEPAVHLQRTLLCTHLGHTLRPRLGQQTWIQREKKLDTADCRCPARRSHSRWYRPDYSGILLIRCPRADGQVTLGAAYMLLESWAVSAGSSRVFSRLTLKVPHLFRGGDSQEEAAQRQGHSGTRLFLL